MGSINPNVLKLLELKSKALIIGVRGNGGLKLEISCYNKLYDKLSHAPDNLVGMVFEISYQGNTKYAKVLCSGSYKWLPPTGREPFPALEFNGVHLSQLADNLSMLEAINDHDDKFKPKHF